MISPRGLADKLIGGPSIVLGGVSWKLAVTHGVLLECESATGRDMLNYPEITNASAKTLQALLWACLARAGALWSIYDVGLLITRRRISAIHAAIFQAWCASMPEPDAATKPTSAKPLTWMESWSLAREGLHLSDCEWLEMTPRQLHALRLRQIERMQREEFLVGIIASTTANFSQCHPRRPMTPDSFMLHKLPEVQEPITGEYLMAQFSKLKMLPKGAK